MKNLKKILTGTLVSVVSATAIGCTTNTNNLAKNIDRSMAEFVSSINKLDYVDTNSKSSEKIGKIVETNIASPYDNKTEDIKKRKITSTGNTISFLNDNISEAEVENTITRPSERNNDFNLFVLSDIPFVTLTSEDAPTDFSFYVKFSTNKIECTSSEIDSKINLLILKRSMLMIYVNEIYSGKVNLSNESKTAINAYVNVLKENTSFLNGNRGMVKNQLGLASDLVKNEKNNDLVNYYIIKSGEALENRASKLDTSISAIDSIIQIIENNLLPSSNYYNSKLSNTYNDLINNIKSSEDTDSEITQNSTNKEIADKISSSLNFTKEQLSESLSENNNSNQLNNNTKDIKQITNNNRTDENSVIKNLNTNTNNTNSNSFIDKSNSNSNNFDNSTKYNDSLFNMNRHQTLENRNNNQINNTQSGINTNFTNNSSNTSRNEYVSSRNNSLNINTNNNEYVANENSNNQNNSNFQNKKTITFPKRNKNNLSQTNKIVSEKNANLSQNNKKKPRNLTNNKNSMQNSNDSNNGNYNNQISQNERFIPEKIETENITTNGDYLKNNDIQNNKINLINTYPSNNTNNNEISKRVKPSNVYRPNISQERPLARRLISSHIVPAENKAVRVPYKSNSNFKVQ